MARSTYYYHTKRLSEPDGNDDARAAIRKIYDHHKGRYGYRRITSQLHNDGIHLNHKTVQKLMVGMNLYGKRKKATTLLTKGLEADTVILVKPSELFKDKNGLKHLYVALTRAVKEIVLIDY